MLLVRLGSSRTFQTARRHLLLDQVSLNPSLLTVAYPNDPYLVLFSFLHTPTIPLLSLHHTTFTSTYMLMIHNCMITAVCLSRLYSHHASVAR